MIRKRQLFHSCYSILLTSQGTVKVADFGLSRVLGTVNEASSTRSHSESHQISGTLPYLAPERKRMDVYDQVSES